MSETHINENRFFRMDCVQGCKEHVQDESVDLIITDPPYGINGQTLHKHYNRNEDFVVGGYVEVPIEDYGTFSLEWITEAERILKPGGQIYIVSGYTNLFHILSALRMTKLREINHIIWKYNFGVYTRTKYVSSHYHILFYEKPSSKHKRMFNLECRFSTDEKNEKNGSLNYLDREDVWIINREYKPGKRKNKNELPTALLVKMIQYSTNEGDIVCDLFLGGFSTAKTAIGLNRKFIGFELSEDIFNEKIDAMKDIKPGYLMETLRKPTPSVLTRQGAKWTDDEISSLQKRYINLRERKKLTKKRTIETLMVEFGRGRFAIENVIRKNGTGEVSEKHRITLDSYLR